MRAINHFRLLFTLLFFCASFYSHATGPSLADVSIEPITYNDNNIVLFRVAKSINYSGAHGGARDSYWWMAVSSHGVWEEILHIDLGEPDSHASDAETTKFLAKSNYYYHEFQSKFNWKRIPDSLLPLIKKYGFKPRPGFNKNEGQGTVTWSSKGICINGKCTKNPVPQRTLGNKSSIKANTNLEFKGKEMITVESAPIQAVFYHAGVALFRNGNYKIVDGKYETTDANTIGAEFDFNKSEKNGEMIDYNFIDAISILPRH